MKLSKPAAIWQGKCPCCRQGDIFKFPATDVVRFSEMNDRCTVCGSTFMPEPGFYFGALFISYAFTVAFFATASVILYFTIRPASWVYLTTIVLVALLSIPVSFRYSRILFLYWFGGITFKGK